MKELQAARRNTQGARFAMRGAILCAGAIVLAGCSTVQPPPLEPRVTTPALTSARVTPAETMKQEEMSGQLVSFGKLRTVIQSREVIIGENKAERPASEMRLDLEKALVARDFRIFSGAVPPDSDIAALTRDTHAQLVITVNAKSEFVNSTGRFSKYRAFAEAKGIRGHDGTILAVAEVEEMGPRNQDNDRAGKLALRAIGPKMADQLVEALLAKTDQLLWAGLVINNVPTMEMALQIQHAIEKKDFVSYVELLDWNKDSQTANFEIIYGLKHESDVALLLNDIPRLKLKPSAYAPGQMEVLRKTLSRYK